MDWLLFAEHSHPEATPLEEKLVHWQNGRTIGAAPLHLGCAGMTRAWLRQHVQLTEGLLHWQEAGLLYVWLFTTYPFACVWHEEQLYRPLLGFIMQLAHTVLVWFTMHYLSVALRMAA